MFLLMRHLAEAATFAGSRQLPAPGIRCTGAKVFNLDKSPYLLKRGYVVYMRKQIDGTLKNLIMDQGTELHVTF